MTLPGFPGQWHFQRVTIQCGCSTVVMSRDGMKVGDVWHCLGHDCSNMPVVAVRDATVNERMGFVGK